MAFVRSQEEAEVAAPINCRSTPYTYCRECGVLATAAQGLQLDIARRLRTPSVVVCVTFTPAKSCTPSFVCHLFQFPFAVTEQYWHTSWLITLTCGVVSR